MAAHPIACVALFITILALASVCDASLIRRLAQNQTKLQPLELNASPPSLSDHYSSDGHILDKLPYLTPNHGVYFLSALAVIPVIIGITIALCKLRRRRQGIPYQNLEMGKPESRSVEIMDWEMVESDEEDMKPVKPPQTGNLVADGIET